MIMKQSLVSSFVTVGQILDTIAANVSNTIITKQEQI